MSRRLGGPRHAHRSRGGPGELPIGDVRAGHHGRRAGRARGVAVARAAPSPGRLADDLGRRRPDPQQPGRRLVPVRRHRRSRAAAGRRRSGDGPPGIPQRSGSAAPAPALPGRPTALEPLAPRPAGNRRRRSAARPGQPVRPAQLRVRRRGARRGAPCLPRDTGPHRADRSARRLVARGRRWRHPPRRRPAAAGAAEPRRPLPSRGRHRDGTAAMVGGRRPGHAGRGRRLEADAVGGRHARLGRGHPRAGRDGDGRGASLSPRRRGADPQPNRRVRRADRARHRSVRRGGRDGDGTRRRTSRTLGRRSRGGHRLRTAAHPAADLDGSQAARRAN
jgi:hypothetical protein